MFLLETGQARLFSYAGRRKTSFTNADTPARLCLIQSWEVQSSNLGQVCD
jgi:hypothetical protein